MKILHAEQRPDNGERLEPVRRILFDSDLATKFSDSGTEDWRFPVVVFLKTVSRYGAISSIGPAGICLLTAVAMRQHDHHELFGPPVQFIDRDLILSAGVSRKSFLKLRERCIQQGWLDFINQPNGLPDLYAVAVPVWEGE